MFHDRKQPAAQKATDIYEATAGQSSLAEGWEDLRLGLRHHRIWRELVRRDLYSRTKGANLGTAWIVLAQAIAIGGMSVVYSQIFGITLSAYLPYLASGLITWGFIISLINEASDVFVYSKGYLTQTRLPLSLCVFRYVARNIILFCYKSSIIVAALLLLGVVPTWEILVVPIGIVFIALAGFLFGITLGLLSARYRDIGQLVSSFSVFLFFMTPIFWHPSRLGPYSWIVDYNPLYHFVSLIRMPLLGEPLSAWSFAMTGGTIAALAIIAAITYKKFGREVIYWL